MKNEAEILVNWLDHAKLYIVQLEAENKQLKELCGDALDLTVIMSMKSKRTNEKLEALNLRLADV